MSKSFIEILYEMKPLEKGCQDNNSHWMRVPGGWIYSDMQGTVFVPFDNEFMPKPKEPK